MYIRMDASSKINFKDVLKDNKIDSSFFTATFFLNKKIDSTQFGHDFGKSWLDMKISKKSKVPLQIVKFQDCPR